MATQSPATPSPTFSTLPSEIRVVIHGAMMTVVEREDPVFQECANCKTKVDPASGKCKKVGTSLCSDTKPGDRVALTNVRLADFTGSWSSVTANTDCLLYTSPSPRDLSTSRMPSSA